MGIVRQVRDWGSSNNNQLNVTPRSRPSLRREFGDGGGSQSDRQRHRVLRSGATVVLPPSRLLRHQYVFSQIPQCSHAVNRSDMKYDAKGFGTAIDSKSFEDSVYMQCHPIIHSWLLWVIFTSSNASVCPHFAPPVTSCLSFRTS